MPTSTSTFGITLAHVGPAPSTLTVAPGCSSAYVAIAPSATPWAFEYNDGCYTNATRQCYPPPIDPALKEKYELGVGYMVDYYSPGVQCPSGWKTVGGMAKPTKGPVTSSGVMTGVPRPSTTVLPMYYPYLDAMSLLLDPGETVVACCPSSMTVNPWGGCYSELTDHPPISTLCELDIEGYSKDELTTLTTNYPINGTTTSGPILMAPTVTAETTWTRVITLDASETAEYVAGSTWGPIFLIHQATDSVSPGQPTETPTDTPTGNAATGRYSAETGPWGQSVRVMGVLAISIVAGMAMVLPW